MKLISKMTKNNKYAIYLEYNIWKIIHDGMILHMNDSRADEMAIGQPFKVICTTPENAERIVNELTYNGSTVTDNVQAAVIDEETFNNAIAMANENQIYFNNNLGHDINQIMMLFKYIEAYKRLTME